MTDLHSLRKLYSFCLTRDSALHRGGVYGRGGVWVYVLATVGSADIAVGRVRETPGLRTPHGVMKSFADLVKRGLFCV